MLRKLVRLAVRFLVVVRQEGFRAALEQAGRHCLFRLGRAQHEKVAELAHIVHLQSQSITWLADLAGRIQSVPASTVSLPSESLSCPRVSVIMAVWNRANFVSKAIESVLSQTYPHWELLVIDDGSTDDTQEIVSRYQSDARLRTIHQRHAGASAARNRGLKESRGDIIAYLDSDNCWYPHYLAAVVETFDSRPDRESLYALQLVIDHEKQYAFVRGEPHDYERLRDGSNYIDLNAFAHRRRVYEERGGCDERLNRCIDWDLALRYTKDAEPLLLPMLGGRYERGLWDRISNREMVSYNYNLMRRNHAPRVTEPLRVLYAVEHYPQLCESYMETELCYMRRRGVHVEVWSPADPAVPYPASVPLHRGSLTAAIDQVRPHVVHCHWLRTAAAYVDEVHRAGLPLTVRAHSFDFSPKTAVELDRHPAVQALFLFPQYLQHWPAGLRKIRPTNACFNPDLHYPEPPKDRRMVFRTGLTKQAKNLEAFIRISRRCPNHHFVLVICRGNSESSNRVQETVDYNHSLGSPVDIRIQLSHAETAALSRKAAIYLHTYSEMEAYGMPVSIAEAMASGSYILGWHCPASKAYIADAGATYATEDEAVARIRETESWSEQEWRLAEYRSIDRAFTHFMDTLVLQPMLDEWVRLASHCPPPGCKHLTDFLLRLGADRALHSKKSFLAHALGVYRVLQAAGCTEDICRAGMFHSIYGTEKRAEAALPLDRRDEVRQLIGERAERLAYLNCVMDRASFDRALQQGDGPYRLIQRISREEIAVGAGDFTDLCRVHFYDWVEKVARSGKWNYRRQAYRLMAERLGHAAQAAYAEVCAQEQTPSQLRAKAA